jgi:hypothetical protein
MNKAMKMWMLAAVLMGSASLVGCGNKNAKPTENKAQTEASAQPEIEVGEKVTCYTAVDDYLVNEIGKNYAQSDVCIPYAYVISTDEGNPNDILIWGDFWVFNYEISGDTLKTVSGGNHPGLMHVKKTETGYEVTSFDAVADGADNLPSAKKIFGDKFDIYQEFSGAAEKREMERLRFTADYVKKHNMSATMLQDYGWPAVALPK